MLFTLPYAPAYGRLVLSLFPYFHVFHYRVTLVVADSSWVVLNFDLPLSFQVILFGSWQNWQGS